MSPKVEVQKNKLLVKWGVASNSSSDEAQQVQGRKTRSMSSRSGESGKVKTSEKVQENKGEDIMREFLEVKDRKKWKYFVDKLGKKDSEVLKSLLFSSDSDSDRKLTLKRGHQKEDTDSDEVRKPKASRRSKRIEQKADNPIIAIDSDEPKIKEEDKPKKKDGEKPKSKNSEPKIKEEDKPKKKDGEKPKIKQEGEKPEIKKEKNGSVEDTQPKIKTEKETVEKEYFIYINGEKHLVRLVSGDEKPEQVDDGDNSDTSVKEEKQPKTLKAFYMAYDSDDNEEKKRKLSIFTGEALNIVG